MIPAFLLIFFYVVSVTIVVLIYSYLNNKKGSLINGRLRFFEAILVFVGPLTFLLSDYKAINDCCNDTAFFSPEHRITMYVLIILSIIVYFYCSYRKTLAPPLLEIVVNCFLLIGIVINIFVGLHFEDFLGWLFGSIPIIFLFFVVLKKNHQLLVAEALTSNSEPQNLIEKILYRILLFNSFVKYPVLLIICLPLLVMLAALLFLFGQKPDSAIKAFTDTYHHGLSQLDYMCNNVKCGGHYLCSVAANGHASIVRPERYGERNGGVIICNRQLLIANAFEELVQEKFPAVHRVIRKQYDHVGDLVHKYYGLFSIKLFADCIYFIMKPLEWIFLFFIYILDRKPENRIAQQYLKRDERKRIALLVRQ